MEVTEIALNTPIGEESFLEANKEVLERFAVKTLIDTMSGNAPVDQKLAAATKALEAIGKSKPVQQALPASTTNIQINAVTGAQIADALKGLGDAVGLMRNAPQIEEGR